MIKNFDQDVQILVSDLSNLAQALFYTSQTTGKVLK